MIFRLRFQQKGGHIHCRLFQATAAGQAWAKNGDLVFDEPGWRSFQSVIWNRIELLPEDDTRPIADVTFSILETTDGPAIECGLCRRVSHHHGDIANRYCGACHIWHDVLAEARFAMRSGGTHECGEWRTAVSTCGVCGESLAS